jgi:hypothetical protein
MWQDVAACRDEPRQQFFTENQTAARLVAEKFCAGCPMLQRCAEAADRRREVGVWAGSLRTRHPAYHRLPLLQDLVLAPMPNRRGERRDDFLTEWELLRSEGLSRRQAAQRLGMSLKTFEAALSRARKAGDPRAVAA